MNFKYRMQQSGAPRVQYRENSLSYSIRTIRRLPSTGEEVPAFDVGFIARTINVHRDSEPICRVRYYEVTASLRVEFARRWRGGEKTA